MKSTLVFYASPREANPPRRSRPFVTYSKPVAFTRQEGVRLDSRSLKPTLSREQQEALEIVLEGKDNVFLTGSAGTGKSILLREIIEQLKLQSKAVGITASTGLAACNIGGLTLHSFAGIGLGDASIANLIEAVGKKKKVIERWNKIEVLIIDEISMVDGDLFDKVEAVARKIRGNGRPFGGLQVILAGDFFQLPPVPDLLTKQRKFAFEAKTWSSVVNRSFVLKSVLRQDDKHFVRLLNEIRLGKVSAEALRVFTFLHRELKSLDTTLKPIQLYPHRSDVDFVNNTRLAALKGPPRHFNAQDWGDIQMIQHCIAPEILELKIGAPVMLIRNLDPDLVNGSMGTVIDFDFYPIVLFPSGREIKIEPVLWTIEDKTCPERVVIARRQQVPLLLAWALTIHKTQGMTLDYVKIDLGKVFEKGQAYVALSRATSLKGLQVLNFTQDKIMAHPKVTQFHEKLSPESTG